MLLGLSEVLLHIYSNSPPQAMSDGVNCSSTKYMNCVRGFFYDSFMSMTMTEVSVSSRCTYYSDFSEALSPATHVGQVSRVASRYDFSSYIKLCVRVGVFSSPTARSLFLNHDGNEMNNSYIL